MIKIKENKAFVHLGTGDVAVTWCKTAEEQDRMFVVLLQDDKGKVGMAEESGRNFPIQEGWVFSDETKNVIGIEASTKESLDVLIETLLEYRKEGFGEG